MPLKDKIQDDTKAALLGGDRFVADTLRNLKAAILNEEVAQNKRDEGLSDEEIEKIIAREVKKRNESLAIYEQNDRPELAETERKEAEIISQYLPEQIDEEKLREIVKNKITELGVSGPQAMGQVIGAVKQQVGNTADGALVARIVKETLNQ
jgi:uncharacterized protein YqeY